MNRRRALGGTLATIAGAVGLTWWQRNALASWALTRNDYHNIDLSTAPGIDEQTCVLTPDQVQGPYFIKAPMRRDVREDRTGVNLALGLQVVNVSTCAPVAGALVEIWHCDAAGRYSGYPEELARRPFDTIRYLGRDDATDPINDKRYLRGAQASDADGKVHFQTILPGWYAPRVAHIHVKVLHDGRSYVTTQLYFEDDLVQGVYAAHPDYAPHGQSPYTLSNDGVLGNNPSASGLLLRPTAADDGLFATAKLGIA